MQQIYKYTISLLLGFCLLTVVNAQNKITVDSVTKKTPIVIKKVPVINWFRVDLDISPIITTLLAKGETYSFEGAVQTSLKNKYFPVAEIGFAGANKTSIDNIDFSTKGMFCRIGTDINVMKQKDKSKKTNNQFLLGVRLGFSHFSYDLNNIVVTDAYWNETRTFDYPGLLSTKFWGEIVGGIRVEVIKNIYMGWSIRYKKLFNEDAVGKISPWYIPGFGVNSSSVWGINYALGYRF